MAKPARLWASWNGCCWPLFALVVLVVLFFGSGGGRNLALPPPFLRFSGRKNLPNRNAGPGQPRHELYRDILLVVPRSLAGNCANSATTCPPPYRAAAADADSGGEILVASPPVVLFGI